VVEPDLVLEVQFFGRQAVLQLLKLPVRQSILGNGVRGSGPGPPP
jgi:hypothetical protein